MNEVITRIVDLPIPFRGAVKEDENGDYNIYINGRLAQDQQAVALRHELRHVKYGHLDDDVKSLEVKEMEAEYGRLCKMRKTIQRDR